MLRGNICSHSHSKAVVITPILHLRKLRLKEVKWLEIKPRYVWPLSSGWLSSSHASGASFRTQGRPSPSVTGPLLQCDVEKLHDIFINLFPVHSFVLFCFLPLYILDHVPCSYHSFENWSRPKIFIFMLGKWVWTPSRWASVWTKGSHVGEDIDGEVTWLQGQREDS